MNSSEMELSARYAILVERLKEGAQRLREGADPPVCADFQLQMVLEFLSHDPALVATDTCAPLMRLYAERHDARQKAKGRSSGGRPSNPYTSYSHTFLAASLECLVTHGKMRAGAATDWLLGEMRRRKLSVPAAGALRGWREDLRRPEKCTSKQLALFQTLTKRQRDKFIKGEDAAKREATAILAMFETSRLTL